MKMTYQKLLRLNEMAGKYLLLKLPKEKNVPKPAAPAQPPIAADWFQQASHIVLNHNSFELGFVEEMFSRFLRQLG